MYKIKTYRKKILADTLTPVSIYQKIRDKLISIGYKFQTTSDTEVVIKLFDLSGVESFQELSGIFSISIYDTNLKKLYLVKLIRLLQEKFKNICCVR